MCKELNRPLPPFSDDDVLDYIVGEACLMQYAKEEAKNRDAQERANWKKGKPGSGR